MVKIDIKEIRDIQKKMIRMLKCRKFSLKISEHAQKPQKWFLTNKKKYKGAHTETIHLRNCVPTHLRGQKIVDEAISDLFKKGILINKKSTGQSHCSLDNTKLKEISEIENY